MLSMYGRKLIQVYKVFFADIDDAIHLAKSPFEIFLFQFGIGFVIHFSELGVMRMMRVTQRVTPTWDQVVDDKR